MFLQTRFWTTCLAEVRYQLTDPVLVIGAGVAGIATAARLARRGYQVTVVEKNECPGGRCGKMEIEGHTFDTGPTLYLMPDLYRQAFAELGERVEDHLELQRVEGRWFVDDDGLGYRKDCRGRVRANG